MVHVECVYDVRANVGESAVWDEREQRLTFVDINAGRIHRFDPSGGPMAAVEVGERVGCLTYREAGGLIIGTESGIYAFDLDTQEKTPIEDPEADKPDNRFNDASTDRQGRWWAGTMFMVPPGDKGGRAAGSFYRLDPDLSLHHRIADIHTTNGLAFSPNGRTMYWSDSWPSVRTIWSADYDTDTGEPGEKRVFFDTRAVAGRPDGGTVDADGCYWMAGVGGSQLVRLTPRGEVDMIVDMPVERPSKPMFGGSDLGTLYVTSIGAGSDQPLAGGLFAVTGLPVGGVPTERFKG